MPFSKAHVKTMNLSMIRDHQLMGAAKNAPSVEWDSTNQIVEA
jgi:hypothetical protein